MAQITTEYPGELHRIGPTTKISIIGINMVTIFHSIEPGNRGSTCGAVTLTQDELIRLIKIMTPRLPKQDPAISQPSFFEEV